MWRKKPAVTDSARAELRDSHFACAATGFTALDLPYDASVWTRTPRPGQDRQVWVDENAAAYAADLGLAAGDAQFVGVRLALEEAADRLLTHTVDLLALPQPARGVRTIVLSLDVLDDQLGMLEHGDPEVFLGFQDIAPSHRSQTTWFPHQREADAFRYSTLSDPAPEPGVPGRLLRAYRQLSAEPLVHLYAMAIFDNPRDVEHVLRAVHRARP